jgi:hypothetical protein
MTIRTFLAKGDWAGQAEIIEGLPNDTYREEDGRVVDLATVYMKTYCHACKKAGHISPAGYRLPSIAVNGQEFALSGDINICDCNPAPVFYAERNMTATITSEDIARMRAVAVQAKPSTHASIFDEQFLLKDHQGNPLSDTYYSARLPGGAIKHGITDRFGRTERIQTDSAREIRIYIGHIPDL